MVDATHLGYPSGKIHMTIIATEVLETTVGTGMAYLLDTTPYEVVNGNVRFLPQLIHGWETPFADHHFIPGGKSGCYSARTMRTTRSSRLAFRVFPTIAMVVLGMAGYTWETTTLDCGLLTSSL